MQILYVEDDPAQAKVVEVMLASEDHFCHCTDSGEQAVLLTKRNDYDLIILDIMLPDIDGYEVMQQLDAKSRGMLGLKEGTLYPVLYRLEGRGFIAARWEDESAPRRGPRRRIYRVTKKGLKELEKRRAAWTTFVSVIRPIPCYYHNCICELTDAKRLSSIN